MGRPRTSQPRNEQLNLSLTASELASLKRRAEAVGMRTVHFGRALLLNEAPKPTRKFEPAGNTAALIHGQLVRLGNNLNQLVRHLHGTGECLPPDLEPLLADIRRLIAQGSSVSVLR